LKSKGLKVNFANVLMKNTAQDYPGVMALAKELGVHPVLDTMITPMMDGDRTPLALNASESALKDVLRNPAFAADIAEMSDCSTEMDHVPCSAAHNSCYVSPYGDVYPCVQFPLPSGNVRDQRFIDIWNHSEQLNDVRSIRIRDLPNCSVCDNVSTCTRCPGLAFMEGNMRGPSTQDCEKSYARTGILSVNLQNKKAAGAGLVQIQALRTSPLVQIQTPAVAAQAASA